MQAYLLADLLQIIPASYYKVLEQTGEPDNRWSALCHSTPRPPGVSVRSLVFDRSSQIFADPVTAEWEMLHPPELSSHNLMYSILSKQNNHMLSKDTPERFTPCGAAINNWQLAVPAAFAQCEEMEDLHHLGMGSYDLTYYVFKDTSHKINLFEVN